MRKPARRQYGSISVRDAEAAGSRPALPDKEEYDRLTGGVTRRAERAHRR